MQNRHRRWNRLLSWGFLFVAGAAIVLSGISSAGAAEFRQTVLYDFCRLAGCADGADPRGALTAGGAGIFYGTTLAGGRGEGTAFQLRLDPVTGKSVEKVLYKFCSRRGCTDGARPEAGLIMDAKGNLYGTSGGGNAFHDGIAFELVFDAATKRWSEKVIYRFCSQAACADGTVPSGPLVMDAAGHLYGMTGAGGVGSAAVGVVFELTFDRATGNWTETVLHSFCSEKKCADGASPSSGVIIDKAGNLYGTTALGGDHSNGTVFELRFDAAAKKWTETVLHSFCPSKVPTCSDGHGPYGGLLMDAAGTIYGTTNGGGPRNGGTAFELSFDQATKVWALATIADFGKRASPRGGEPDSALAADASGNLYGTTTTGGAGKVGTAVRLRFDPALKRWGLRVLYAFCSKAACLDGGQPSGGLIVDAAGDLYGATRYGGAHGGGTVFELSPP